MAGVGGALLALALVPLLHLASLLVVEPGATVGAGRHATADVIVVLGGDGARRARHAAALYADGWAPRVLVTGEGDCREMAAVLRGGGVPRSQIGVECRSRNTWENAQLSAPILARWSAEEAVLVTSWFHMRRAMISFGAAAPELRLVPSPTPPPRSLVAAARTMDGAMAAQEPIKLAWYALRYGAPVSTRLPGD